MVIRKVLILFAGVEDPSWKTSYFYCSNLRGNYRQEVLFLTY